jgi:hypothetical protein
MGPRASLDAVVKRKISSPRRELKPRNRVIISLSVKVMNAWSYTSTPQYFFMEWCLVKHRDNFTF